MAPLQEQPWPSAKQPRLAHPQQAQPQQAQQVRLAPGRLALECVSAACLTAAKLQTWGAPPQALRRARRQEQEAQSSGPVRQQLASWSWQAWRPRLRQGARLPPHWFAAS